MQLSDVKNIKASPETVWAAILNPEVLRLCVPGCQSMTGSVDEGFEATVKQKIGPVSATFAGVVKLSDIDPVRAVTISGEGKGGAAGYAKGGAKVRLTPVDLDGTAGTELAYEVEASVGGKIAQLGSRLIDGFAKKMADEFFSRFQDALEAPDEVADEAEGTEEAPKKGWFKRMIRA